MKVLTARGFVNIFYMSSLEAGEWLSRARLHSVLAGLAARKRGFGGVEVLDKNPSQDILVHVGCCEDEKHLRGGLV